MLHPVPSSSARHGIDRRYVLEPVKHHSYGAIAETVHHDLPTAPIHCLYDVLELSAAVVRLPALRGVIRVRRQHERCVRFNDAIHEHLDEAGLEPW